MPGRAGRAFVIRNAAMAVAAGSVLGPWARVAGTERSGIDLATLLVRSRVLDELGAGTEGVGLLVAGVPVATAIAWWGQWGTSPPAAGRLTRVAALFAVACTLVVLAWIRARAVGSPGAGAWAALVATIVVAAASTRRIDAGAGAADEGETGP